MVSESKEQAALVTKLRSEGHFVFAIPNGGLRDARTAATLKREGALAGIPDLCMILREGGCLWIELKRRDCGRVSATQKDVHQKLWHYGHEVIVAHGAKDAYEKIKNYLTRSEPD